MGDEAARRDAVERRRAYAHPGGEGLGPDTQFSSNTTPHVGDGQPEFRANSAQLYLDHQHGSSDEIKSTMFVVFHVERS